MSLTTLIIDDEKLARDELAYLLSRLDGVELLAQGANGIEAVELILTHRPDLVFLDVQMPGLDGFAVLKRLVERAEAEAGSVDPFRLPQIVFATAYDQYAVRAFEVNAVDYLLKPFDEHRLAHAVGRVRARLATESASASSSADGSAPDSAQKLAALLRLLERPTPTPLSRVVVQAQGRMLLVDQAEICFAAIDEGVIRIVTPSCEGQSKCRTLEELLEQLDPSLFWRAHRGFVVNLNHIREVVPWFNSTYQLRMDDKAQTEVPVSRTQTRRLRELFNL